MLFYEKDTSDDVKYAFPSFFPSTTRLYTELVIHNLLDGHAVFCTRKSFCGML